MESPIWQRDFIESLIMGDIHALEKRGIKIYREGSSSGILYIKFTDYKI